MKSTTAKVILASCAVLVASMAVVAAAGARAEDSLTGAGSTFVFPLVSKWIPAYQQAAGTTVTYGSVGSGAGIAQITARTVDFGASDAPLTPDQATACKSCVQIPWAVSGTSIDYNLKGLPSTSS